MPTPSEVVRAAQAALNDLTHHLDVIDTFAERKAGADASIEALGKEYDALRAKVRETQAKLDEATSLLTQKTALIDDSRARALADINAQIKAGTEELAQLEVALKAKREAHDQVLASMGSLAKRLNLGTMP